MGHGRNIISEHLSAFAGGAMGIGAIFFKPILLDATRTASGFWAIAGFYAVKFFIFSVTTLLGGMLTAWGTDLYKNYPKYRKLVRWKFWKNNKDKNNKAA